MGRGQGTRARAAAAELAAALQQWWLPATRCGNGGARAKGRRRATLLIGLQRTAAREGFPRVPCSQ